MKFWNKKVLNEIDNLSIESIQELITGIWDTLYVNYDDETDLEKIRYIKYLLKQKGIEG